MDNDLLFYPEDVSYFPDAYKTHFRYSGEIEKLYVHVGRGCMKGNYWDRCMSALIVADKLFRDCDSGLLKSSIRMDFERQKKLPVPLSFAIRYRNNRESLRDPSIAFEPFDGASMFPKGYLRQAYHDHIRYIDRRQGDFSDVEQYDSFQKKVRQGLSMIYHIIDCLKRYQVMKNYHQLIIYLECISPYLRVASREHFLSNSSLTNCINS